ncbi:MAG TPA: DUF448 domain-containing protein [Armatimonadota bacterium]|nr:DUF448 domain-containing protein [Armatimonadota bacterium]
MCIVCRARRPQGALLRVSRGSDGPRVDGGRRRAGRGAYVCRTDRCVETAITRQAFRRALGAELTAAAAAELRRLAADAAMTD